MLATPTKYTLRALLLLAQADEDEFLSVQQLAEEADVPAPYLSKLIKTLAQKDLVHTKKGVLGGVRLAKSKISFLEVCQALDDPIVRERCFLSNTKCQAKNPCQFHARWQKERAKTQKFLRGLKISAV